MRIVEPATSRRIERFGSSGATARPVARAGSGGATLVRIDLEPGGVLGRHEAVATQLFIVMAGSGSVSGGDDAEYEVAAGSVVVWEAKESHETRAGPNGLTAIVFEGHIALS